MEYLDVLDEYGHLVGKKASRKECHEKGLWHRVVSGFILNQNGDVLLQKRCASKRVWPNMWDITAGGHVASGEFGREALIREVREEIGINIDDENIKFLTSSIAKDVTGGVISNHFCECYIINKSIDINKVKIQKEEVSEVKWFKKEEILARIDNDYDGITRKIGTWETLKRYYNNVENINKE